MVFCLPKLVVSLKAPVFEVFVSTCWESLISETLFDEATTNQMLQSIDATHTTRPSLH